MKKIVFALAALSLVACKKEETKPVDYTLITGQYTNPNSDQLTIYKGRDSVKGISVDKNGKFADTLRLAEGSYVIYDGTEQASIYVKKGNHFNITLDTKEFDKTIKFTGTGAAPNTYFAEQSLLQDALDFDGIMSGDQANFDAGITKYKSDFLALLKEAKGLDSLTLVQQNKSIETSTLQLNTMYAAKIKMNEMIGKPAASFNFDNHKGGKTTLEDLAGKYVYIDVWATWCGPCKREIPALKAIEKEYHDKNIEFVSISVDKNKAAWTTMVTEKNLGGVQLHFGGDRSFSQAFNITGIPRFILLDPKGNIVNPDAPRPSSPELKTLFNKENI